MIIGVSGKMHSGKGTFSEALSKRLDIKIKRFADPLKKASSVILSLPETQGYSQEGKDYILSNIPYKENGRHISFGRFLQLFGSAFREIFWEDIWADIALLNEKDVILEDLRYKNEARAVRSAGGILVRMERPGYSYRDPARDPNHASEIDMDDWSDWDFVINNTGSIEDLKKEANRVAGIILTSR